MDDDYGVGVLLLIIPGWIFPWTPLLLGSIAFLIVQHAPAYYLVFVSFSLDFLIPEEV